MSVDAVWEFRSTRVKFGLNAVKEIGYELMRLKAIKVGVITDPGVAKTGIPDKIADYIREMNLKPKIWDRVEPEPSDKSMEAGVEWAREEEFDSYVSVGGGSSMDTAKVINLVTSYGGTVLDYVAKPTGKGRTVPGLLKAHISVPTTAGTGSETSPTSVVSLTGLELKVGISSDYCRPDLAIIDPLLHVSMPLKVTANTGMDALSHAIESYITRKYDGKPMPKTPFERPVYGGSNPLTDALAEKAIELIGKYLRRAYYNGLDIEARSGMALASHLAGASFTNAGLTAVHAMAFPIGGGVHTSHGETVAALLPSVMKFMIPTDPARFVRIAEFLGERVSGLSLFGGASKSVEAVIRLMKDINIANGIHTFGIRDENIPKLAEDTLKIQRLLAGNPRPTSQSDLEGLFRDALKYW